MSMTMQPGHTLDQKPRHVSTFEHAELVFAWSTTVIDCACNLIRNEALLPRTTIFVTKHIGAESIALRITFRDAGAQSSAMFYRSHNNNNVLFNRMDNAHTNTGGIKQVLLGAEFFGNQC